MVYRPFATVAGIVWIHTGVSSPGVAYPRRSKSLPFATPAILLRPMRGHGLEERCSVHFSKPELHADDMLAAVWSGCPFGTDVWQAGPACAKRATRAVGRFLVDEGRFQKLFNVGPGRRRSASAGSMCWAAAACTAESTFQPQSSFRTGTSASVASVFPIECGERARWLLFRQHRSSAPHATGHYQRSISPTNATGLESNCQECRRNIQRASAQAMRPMPLPAATQSPERRCTACKQVKVRSAFYVDMGESRGVRYICKDCSSLKGKIWYWTRRTETDRRTE